MISLTPEARLKALILTWDGEIVACGGKAKEECIEGGLIPRVKYLLRFNQQPDFLVVHYGGNSNGAVKLRELRCQIKE